MELVHRGQLLGPVSGAPSGSLRLRAELENESVISERYARRTFCGRCKPVLILTSLALSAVVGSIVLREATKPPVKARELPTYGLAPPQGVMPRALSCP